MNCDGSIAKWEGDRLPRRRTTVWISYPFTLLMLIAPNLVRVSVLPALPLLLSDVKERSVRADDLIGSRGVRKPNASVRNGQRFVGILSPLKLCQCTQP